MTTTPQPTTLPEGSLNLVTGANGYIGAHVVQQFLQRGYKVRGTVRSLAKAQWLVTDLFAKEASAGRFELVEVPDMAREGAYDEAMRGVSGVAHIATISTWSPDPNEVIPQTIAGVVNALKAAQKAASVKQFVYTSTVGTAIIPQTDTPFHVDQSSWNDAIVPLAWAPPPYEPSRAMVTYVASKVEAERALWRFVEQEKPAFAVNAVLPFQIFGPLLHEKQNASTAGLLFTLYDGNVDMHVGMPASKCTITSCRGDTLTDLPNLVKCIHVREVALMHVAAILDPSVENARIHTWSDAFNWNHVLKILRRLYPERTFPYDLEGMGNIIGTVDDRVGRELLKKWDGRDGWTGLEEGVKDTLEGKRPVALGIFH